MTACPRASRAAAMLSPTKPVPPKIRIFMSQPQHLPRWAATTITIDPSADSAIKYSQQDRTEIPRRIHVGDKSAGRLRRLASRAREEAAGTRLGRTLAVRDDHAAARQHRDRPAAQLAAGIGRIAGKVVHHGVGQRDLTLRVPNSDITIGADRVGALPWV